MSQPRLLGDFTPATYDQWRALVKADDFDRKLVTRTLDGFNIQPLYTAADVPEQGFPQLAGAPGGSWEMRQHAASTSVDSDPIGHLAAKGSLLEPLESYGARLAARAQDAAATTVKQRPVIVAVNAYHDAGASPATEIAVALSTYVTYLRWLNDAGMSIKSAARCIEISCGVGTDFFGELAKLRALRLCIGKVLTQCGVDIDDSTVSIHAAMSQRSLTRSDPWVNMLRATTETFAAAAGGANAITTASYDALLGDESDLGRRIADNAQLILDEESHVRAVTDPGAGSYYIETLTLNLARAAWQTFTEIEGAGGIVQALQSGRIQDVIKQSASKVLADIRTRKRPITGVSEFALISESPLPTASSKDAIRKDAAVQVEALMPVRLSAAYETLRARSDAYLAQHGSRPSLFLCNVGSAAQWKARAGFTQNLAWAGGIHSLSAEQGRDNADAACAAFAASGAKVAAICSTDDLYPELVPTLAKQLRALGASLVVVAGKPGAAEASYREAGAGLFIHMGCDVVAALETMLDATGAKS